MSRVSNSLFFFQLEGSGKKDPEGKHSEGNFFTMKSMTIITKNDENCEQICKTMKNPRCYGKKHLSYEEYESC